jgi:hypothetical protein
LVGTTIAITVAVVACEGSHLYFAARIGARLSTDGEVEIVAFGCSDSPLTKLEATKDSRQLWSAEPSQPSSGLVSVPSSGIPGWKVQGAISPTSAERVSLFAMFQDEGDQTLGVTPSTLDRGVITVDPSSFGGKDHVTEEEFKQTNEKWCASRR